MAPSQTEIESQIIELAEKSFKTFCDDISDMFGMDMACDRQEVKHETVEDLQMRFENLAVVYSVKSESAKGVLDGTFQMLFDRKGLFILAGVVAMQPGQIILEDITSGSLEKAEKASNVLNEVGTALVGSWDRVFRKGLDGHGRFLLTNTFIGNPWDKSEEKIGLNIGEELVFVPYDMTICPYPAFKCGAIFPKTIFAGTFGSGDEQPALEEEKAREDTEETAEPEESAAADQPQPEAEETPETEEKARQDTEETSQVETEEATREDTEKTTEAEESAAGDQAQPEAEETAESEELAREDTEETAEPEEGAAADQPQPEAEETVAADESAVKQEPEAAAEQEPGDVEGETATISETDIAQKRPVSDAIKKMATSTAGLVVESAPSAMAETPGSKDTLLTVCAKDIMQKEVVWANPDDSVQQALSKMQQHNTGYIMIGKKQVPEGIVSKSDLAGALSPYLRNIFVKWRRPLDDATLKIKIKWIMSKPTCTINPQTPLVKIMENMCQTDKKCLPVVDDKGKVRGLVTVFDVFRALLKHSCPR
jgi:CBS domain-containing protein